MLLNNCIILEITLEITLVIPNIIMQLLFNTKILFYFIQFYFIRTIHV